LPYTIRGDDPDDPPNMNLRPFVVTGDYWRIRDLLWDSHDDWAIQVGDDVTGAICKNLLVYHCYFQHSHHQGVEIFYGENIAIIRCNFLDLRRKVEGVDLDAVDLRRYAKNILFQECVFEGIGSDGIHIFPNVAHVDDFCGRVDIVRCRFRRPVPYASWAYFDPAFGSVGENGIDCKRVESSEGYGPVSVMNCIFTGFIDCANHADCSDGGDGGGYESAIVVHDGSDVFNIHKCFFHNCNYAVGLQGTDVTNPGAAAWITSSLIHDCDQAGIVMYEATELTVQDSLILECALSLDSHETPTHFHHNVVDDCPLYTLSTAHGEEQDFHHNLWAGTSTKPAAWDNSDNDPA